MYQTHLVLMTMLFSTTSCSRVTEQAPAGVLYWPLASYDEAACVLPCHVELSSTSTPPQVVWLYESNSNSFVALDDSNFWNKEYKEHYCDKIAYPYPDFRDYAGPSHYSCIHQTGTLSGGDNASYNCSLELDEAHCFLGNYMCSVSVSENDTEQVVKEVETRVKVPPLLIIEPPLTICFQPHAESITAELSVDKEGGEKIEVAWMSTVQPKNTSCNLEHCPGSKRYDVKMLVFNSIPLNNMANPDYETEWHKVEKRQTSFLFSDSVIFSEKYFLFQLRNRNKRRSRYGYYVPHEPIQTESSGLFYFGEQVGANLTEPLLDTVHSQLFGESVPIICSATGLPVPSVTLSHDQYGELVVIQESISGSTVQIDFIVNSSQRFVCSTKNYVVNKFGEVEEVVRTASVTVNMYIN